MLDKIVFSPPELGCVLYLPGLPGGSNKIYDRSPYGNIGTIIGAVWNRLPSGLWCLDFDGTDDHANFGNPSSLQITSSMTILVWVNQGNTADGAILFKDTGVSGDRGWYHTFVAGKPRLFLSIDGSSGAYRTADNAVIVGTWYLLGAVYDAPAQTIVLYKNGTVDPSTLTGTVPASQFNCSGDVWMGERSDGAIDLTCLIGLVRVYNRALSALEVQNCYNRERHLFGI